MSGKLLHILDLHELKAVIERKASDIGQPMSFFLAKAGYDERQWARGGDFGMLLEVGRQAGVELHAVSAEGSLPRQDPTNPNAPARRSANGLYDSHIGEG